MSGAVVRARPVLTGAALIVGGVLLGVGIGAALTVASSGSPSAAPLPTATATAASPAATPTPTDEPAAAPRPAPGPDECVDALGDGGTFDLDRVSLRVDGDDLVVRFTLAETAEGEGSRSLGITAVGDRSTSAVLGARWLDGRPESVFTAELRDGRSRSAVTELTLDRIDVSGREVLVRFPLDALDRLGESWSWTATASADSAGDRCGDPGVRFEG